MTRVLRRFVCAVMGWLPCATCGRQTVGFSHFCRKHTDEIFKRERVT